MPPRARFVLALGLLIYVSAVIGAVVDQTIGGIISDWTLIPIVVAVAWGSIVLLVWAFPGGDRPVGTGRD